MVSVIRHDILAQFQALCSFMQILRREHGGLSNSEMQTLIELIKGVADSVILIVHESNSTIADRLEVENNNSGRVLLERCIARFQNIYPERISKVDLDDFVISSKDYFAFILVITHFIDAFMQISSGKIELSSKISKDGFGDVSITLHENQRSVEELLSSNRILKRLSEIAQKQFKARYEISDFLNNSSGLRLNFSLPAIRSNSNSPL